MVTSWAPGWQGQRSSPPPSTPSTPPLPTFMFYPPLPTSPPAPLSQGQSVLFMETYMTRSGGRHHAVLDVVPVTDRQLEKAKCVYAPVAVAVPVTVTV